MHSVTKWPRKFILACEHWRLKLGTGVSVLLNAESLSGRGGKANCKHSLKTPLKMRTERWNKNVWIKISTRKVQFKKGKEDCWRDKYFLRDKNNIFGGSWYEWSEISSLMIVVEPVWSDPTWFDPQNFQLRKLQDFI